MTLLALVLGIALVALVLGAVALELFKFTLGAVLLSLSGLLCVVGARAASLLDLGCCRVITVSVKYTLRTVERRVLTLSVIPLVLVALARSVILGPIGVGP